MKSRILAVFCAAACAVAAESSLPEPLAVSDLTVSAEVLRDDVLAVSEQLRYEIVQKKRFRVVERAQMETVLKEQGFQQSGCTSEACAVEAGQLLGVRYMVVGSLGTAGSYTMLSIRMVDVGTGEVVASTIAKSSNVNALVKRDAAVAITDLVAGFDEKVNGIARPVQAAPRKRAGKTVAIVPWLSS